MSRGSTCQDWATIDINKPLQFTLAQSSGDPESTYRTNDFSKPTQSKPKANLKGSLPKNNPHEIVFILLDHCVKEVKQCHLKLEVNGDEN